MSVLLRRSVFIRWLCCATWLPLLGSGCADSSATSSPAPHDGRYRIVCTVGMVTDIVRQVAGDRAEVVPLYGAVDPHTYEPTAADIQQILDADVVFYCGLLLEGPTQSALERAETRGIVVHAVAQCLAEDEGFLRYPPEFESHPDPHVWGDVAAWSRCVEYVAKQLSEYDPPGAESYAKNASAYRQQLVALDDYARSHIATIPESSRQLVTAHDAFGYFSRAYQIPVHSVLGVTTESEAGADDINRLVDFIVANKVPAVFVEETVNQDNLKAVIAGAKSRGWSVKIGGSLYSDSMGPPGTYEGTYIGMMDSNVTKIVRSLGGDAPEFGMQGKLTR
jgi:manganese/zinc/iron transport system substrate-binding protein